MGFEYKSANWRFIDLPRKLEDTLNCNITKMNEDKVSMDCTFKGFWNAKSKCRIDIEHNKNKTKVILTELKENQGTSVTNMVEHLATMTKHQFLHETPAEKIEWIEHYEMRGESFDKVEMLWDDERFSNPKWRPLKSKDYR